MQVSGKWHQCSDGAIRPVLEGHVLDGGGQPLPERFLVDTGADCSVFSGAFLLLSALPGRAATGNISVKGVGGTSPIVVVTTTIQFTRTDGVPVHVRGDFAAFTDPYAIDMSVLGRDVLNNFDLIVSRPRDEILLLSGNHVYLVHAP